METRIVPIDTLSADPSNVRKHGDKNIAAIKASLKRFGQQKPIVVDGNLIVRAGNGTLQAAQELGWDEISVIQSGLAPSELVAFAIADNRTAELADWDMDGLAKQLAALDEEGISYDELGFDDHESAPGNGGGLTDPDEVPEVTEPVVKRGEIWKLGKHRLMCGDSTAKADVDRLMGGEARPNLMVTDPPYGVNLDQSWRDKALGKKALGKGNAKKIQNDDRADWTEVYAQFSGNIAYVWHASCQADLVKVNLEDANFDVRQMIVWNKSVMVMGRSAYHWKHEPCWYAVRKGKDANWLGDRKQTTVWDAASPNHIMGGSKDDKTEHPSQKPISICVTPIVNHVRAGDSVYDPFLGSGSTLIACEKTNRRCYGCEIDAHYCSVVIQRWKDFTGKEAYRINDDGTETSYSQLSSLQK